MGKWDYKFFHRRKGRQLLYLIWAIALVFTSVSPALAEPLGTIGKKTPVKKVSAGQQLAKEKIDQQMFSLFQEDKYVTYLVKMNEQTDVDVVAKAAEVKSLAKHETKAQQKLSVRQAVVSSLREMALSTQSGLTAYLDKMKQTGEVKDYESFFIVNALAVTSTKEVMEKIAAREEVAKILPNYERFLIDGELVTAEEAQAKQLSVPSSGDTPAADDQIEWNIERVGAPAAWALGIDGSGMVVANLDTGVDMNHPALSRKWRGLTGDPSLSWYDAHSGATRPVDSDGHGTHTMGTMVGSTEDGQIIGVAPGAQWIAVRVFNPSTTDQILLRGGEWILAPRDAQGNLHPEAAPDSVNNSWGSTSPGMDEWYRPMVQAWRAAGIFPAFANGNLGPGAGTASSPGNYPESFAVGAVNINNEVASFSSRGPSPYGEIKPNIAAPGVNIRSSIPGGGYANYNGTSMATPHVAAAAALIMQANTSLTVDDIAEILISTATPLTDAQYSDVPNNAYGHGLLNVYDAVSSVLTGVGTVEGRVTTGGDDFEPPVITHEPVQEVFYGYDVSINAHVKDNVSVTNVELFARKGGDTYWTYIPMKRISGDYRDGVYEATIPGALTTGSAVEYYIRANDYGNNVVDTEIYRIIVSKGVKPGYYQNFEENWDGFQTGGVNNTWSRGMPETGPRSGHSGQYALASNLTGTYQPNTNSWVMMPPIDLTDHPSMALLTFWHWYDLENRWDFGRVYVAAESTDYDFVKVAEFTGRERKWQQVAIDLTPYSGEVVYVLWNLTSDRSVEYDGWFIDDVSIVGPADTPPAAPDGVQATVNQLGHMHVVWQPVDDIHVKDYVVYVKKDGEEDWRQAAMGEGSETYVFIQSSGSYDVSVRARTYDGTVGEMSEPITVNVEVPHIIFFDNFNGTDDNGWRHEGQNDIWERGVPKKGPGRALIPPNVWATGLSGNYSNNMNASLVSPRIDLTNEEHAALSFYHWYEIETNWDKAYVEITTDGGLTWQELAMYSHVSKGKQWSSVTIDLDPYVGQTVQIRFRFYSDSSVNYLGWILDNVGVYATHVNSDLGARQSAQDGKADKSDKEGTVNDVPSAIQLPLHQTGNQSVSEHSLHTLPPLAPASLPVTATVTALEVGKSTKTDPATGKYSMRLGAGEYTLRAEAYGFYPSDQTVTIEDGKTSRLYFSLTPIPQGTIHGTVIDERTHEPIAGATVLVMEDAHIAPVQTDDQGEFTLTVYEGDYTLSVSHPEYYLTHTNVHVNGGETTDISIAMKPFIGFDGVIAYDSGAVDNAWAYYDPGNGWAVRMTPAYDQVQVVGGLFRFWDTSWPSPGGTAFKVAIFDHSGKDGAPGKLIYGPIDATAKRDGTWTEVRFSEPVMLEGDFYLTVIQAGSYPNVPGLATDETGVNSGRNWQYVDGAWSQAAADDGNYLIRALVRYPVGAPVITQPVDGSFTNVETITVEGTLVVDGAVVSVYNGDERVGQTTVENGTFSLPITLHDGENIISAEAEFDGKLTDRSKEVHVTLKKTRPHLTVDRPLDGFKTNLESLHVMGTVEDPYLDVLTVNNEKIEVMEDGSFDHRVFLNPGANTLTITAKDKAGNATTVERTVYMNQDAPNLSITEPLEDITLHAGEKLIVRANGDTELNVHFRLELPLQTQGDQPVVNAVYMPEVEPGSYIGEWTVPAGLLVNGVHILVQAQDGFGNQLDVYAPGKLNIVQTGNDDGNTPPGDDGSIPPDSRGTVFLTNDSNQIIINQPFRLSVQTNHLTDMYAFQFSLVYPTEMEFKGFTLSEALNSWQQEHGANASPIVHVVTNERSDGHFQTDVIFSFLGDVSGISGSQALGSLEMVAHVAGNMTVKLSGLRFLDSQGEELLFEEPEDLTIQVIEPDDAGTPPEDDDGATPPGDDDSNTPPGNDDGNTPPENKDPGTLYDITGFVQAEAFNSTVPLNAVWYEGADGTVSVQIVAYDAEGKRVAIGSVSAEGHMHIALPAGGTYTLVISVPGHLPYRVSVNADGPQVLDLPVFIAGDVNSDGVIDLKDLQLVAKHFGKQVPWSNRVEALTDINRDGEIDLLDISYILQNFGQRY